MKKAFFIPALFFIFACNSSRYVYDELSFVQRTSAQVPKEQLPSLLIVGTGNVEARQIIDMSVDHFRNFLSAKNIYTGYFFVANDELNDRVVRKKMQDVKSGLFKYLLFISEEEPAVLTASGPRLALNLNMTLFEKDNDRSAWKADVSIFGKIYRKQHSERISQLLQMHMRANRFVP